MPSRSAVLPRCSVVCRPYAVDRGTKSAVRAARLWWREWRHAGLGAGREREDRPAAVVDRPGARRPRRLGVGRARRAGCAAVLARGGGAAARRRLARRVRREADADASSGEGLVTGCVELGSLGGPVVLVIDDLHELRARRRAPARAPARPAAAAAPCHLATRHDPQLGLHRLRLAGQLTELRAPTCASR